MDNVHYVNRFKYNHFGISQICDKGYVVKFLYDRCLVTNCVTNKVFMSAKIIKNTYVVEFFYVEVDNLSCLSAQADNAKIRHRQLGHVDHPC